AGRVTRVGVVVPGVVVVVVHHRETFLIGGRALAEVAVPGSGPSRIVGILDPVGPRRWPGARFAADRRRAPLVACGIGLEVAGARLEAHHAVVVRTDPLPLAEP